MKATLRKLFGRKSVVVRINEYAPEPTPVEVLGRRINEYVNKAA